MLEILIILIVITVVGGFAMGLLMAAFQITEKLLTLLWHALLWLCDATGYLTLAIFHVLTSKKI